MNPKRTRRRFTAEFKAELALAALMERQLLAELAARYHLSVEQINCWKSHLRQQAVHVLAAPIVPMVPLPDAEPLYAAIGRLQMKNQLLKKRCPHARNPTTRRSCGQR
jgi:transposase